MKKLSQMIKRCRKCPLWRYRKNPVPGEGPLNSKLFFVGEAPGRLEDETGRPFVGPSGKFLEKLLNSIGLKRKNVFLTGIVKCRPPNNRKPTRKEIEACKRYTLKQIEIIRPSLIIVLGATASEGLLDIRKIGKLHGKIIEKNGNKYFITFHPSAARRFPKIRKLMIKDFKKLKSLLIKEKIWNLKLSK